MKFNATLSTAVKLITVATCILLVTAVYTIINRPELTLVYKSILIGSFVALVIGTFLFSVTGYTINAGTVTINRWLYNVNINRADITEYRVVPDEDMKWTIRTFGVGGLFGYYGRFTNTNLGGMTWYATRRSNYVLLVAGGKKIIVTPDDTEAFIATLGS